MTLARFYSIPTLLQGAALTGSYVLTGLLSLDLSANDGLASMVWPPAGIALAATWGMIRILAILCFYTVYRSAARY